MRQYFIDGYEVEASGFYFSDQLNQRTTCDITVTNLSGLNGLNWRSADTAWQDTEIKWDDDIAYPATITLGDELAIYEDSDLIFAGLIKNVTVYEDAPGVLFYDLSASDFTSLADKRIIAKVYTNELAGDIVKDIIDILLVNEGVIYGTIQDGVVIKKAVFDYKTTAQAMDYLAELCGFSWYIDENKALQFFSRESNVAPFPLNDSVFHSNFKQVSNLDQYRNVQFTRGGRGETGLQTDEKPSPKPDGQTRTFTLRFPLATKPIIKIDSVVVAPEDIGINGKDANKEWYYTINGNTITQDLTLTPLNTEIVEVTYKGYRNLFGRVENPSQINIRKQFDAGTSGIYEKITEEKSIADPLQLTQFNKSLVDRYGKIDGRVTFKTHAKGLKSGQLLTIQKPLYGISAAYLIDSVQASNYGELVEYSIVALDGSSLGGWDKFFKDMFEASKTFVIAENEVLIIANDFSENKNRSASYAITIFQSPVASETLFVGTFVCGGGPVGGVTLND
jgi:hypothetical protein